MSVLAGWSAIILVLFAVVISIVPGVISVTGLMISMLAVVVSLFSIKKNGRKYFGVTISLALAGTFLVNDGLRIWDPLALPLNIKIGLYSAFLFVLSICSLAAYQLGQSQEDTDNSVNPDRPSAGR